MISVISTYSGLASSSSYSIDQKTTENSNQTKSGNSTSAETSSSQSLSSLSRLLAASASRLDALDRNQLAATASKAFDQVMDGDWRSTPTGETEIRDSSD